MLNKQNSLVQFLSTGSRVTLDEHVGNQDIMAKGAWTKHTSVAYFVYIVIPLIEYRMVK